MQKIRFCDIKRKCQNLLLTYRIHFVVFKVFRVCFFKQSIFAADHSVVGTTFISILHWLVRPNTDLELNPVFDPSIDNLSFFFIMNLWTQYFFYLIFINILLLFSVHLLCTCIDYICLWCKHKMYLWWFFLLIYKYKSIIRSNCEALWIQQ